MVFFYCQHKQSCSSPVTRVSIADKASGFLFTLKLTHHPYIVTHTHALNLIHQKIMNISTINKILLPILIITAAVFTAFCVISNQWRIVTIGPAKLNVGLYHLCRAGGKKLNFLITHLVDERTCIGLLELKEKVSIGSGKIPETLEVHVASCAMFPFIILSSFIAIVTSTISSLPFVKPKREMMMIIATSCVFITGVLEIVTGWLYRSDLFKQQHKLEKKINEPFGEGFFESIGNKIAGGDNIFNDFLTTVHEIGSGALVPGNASIFTMVVGCVNMLVFGYAVFVLVSDRKSKGSKFVEGVAMY